ncbi:MAG: DUF6338 family protein [Chloroflexota bacterium]
MPASREALFIALLAIAPGWIAVQVWARSKTWVPPSTDLRTVLQAIWVSVVVQIVAWPILGWRLFGVRNDVEHHTTLAIWWAVLVVLIIPLLGGLLAGKLSDALHLRKVQNPTPFQRAMNYWWPTNFPGAWDALFAQGIPDGAFLVLQLDDGKLVAGAYGANSYVTTTPQEKGIYLETEWLIDEDGFVTTRVLGSQGVLVHDASKVGSVRIQRGQA